MADFLQSRRVRSATVISLLFSCVSTAYAARVVEEVVVTAQKTEQSLQEVPVSISTLDASVVQDAALDDVQDMVQYVPNVKFNSNANIPVIAIRGFGTGLAGRGIESPVGSVIDDVFYGHPSYLNDGVFDIKRMDVLRGPQGALFGKNTIAGVLNFVTEEAGLEWDANLSALYTSLDGAKYEGGITVPLLEDKLGMRIAFRSNRRDLGAYNSTADKEYTQEEYSGRIKMLWLVNESVDVFFNAWYHHRDVNGVSRPVFVATDQALEKYREIDPDAEGDGFDENTSTNFHGYFARRSEGASIKTEWRPEISWAENASVTTILGYALTRTPFDFDADYSPIDLLEFATRGPDIQEQESIEIRFAGSIDAPFGWGKGAEVLVGLFGQRQKGEISNILRVNLNGFPDYIEAGALGAPNAPINLLGLIDFNALPINARESIESYTITEGSTQAIFSQLIWYLRDDLDLTLGLRLGRERKAAEIAAEADAPTGIAPLVLGQEDFYAERRSKESEVSPKIALSWHFNDELTFFGNIAKGFKSGGFQAAPLTDNNLSFDSENALSSEIGIKSRLFEGSLVLNAAIFNTKFDNLQVINFDGTNFTTLNAAQATSRGFELDFIWLPPWEALTISGSLGKTEAKYTEYECAPVALDGSGGENPDCDPTNSDADPTNDGTGTPGQDLSGKTVAFAPEFSASLYPTLRFPLSKKRGINGLFAIDVLYQGDYYLDSDLDENTFRPATTKINARFGVSSENKKWSVVLNAKNLTGIKEAGPITDQPILPGNYVGYATTDEPIYTVDFRFQFPGE